MINFRLNKHDQYVDGLCETLESRYDIILRGVPLYSKKRRCIAEIDILAAELILRGLGSMKDSFKVMGKINNYRKVAK